ncbi:mucin-2-like [Conger conger]|uniref:mucin-2-like n=1 Tax=Conger conger TaxID=82655 RepID=UPI002A5A2EDF|nr:mucin-2-like [Conger conger]
MDPLHSLLLLLLLLLFIARLSGAGGVAVWTQSRVAAEEGSSVSVACHYGPQYKDSVKYWCRGLFWSSCIVLQRTDSTQKRAGLSITDDPAQQVFTVTLSDLRVWDSNRYWCAVKVKGIETPDPKAGVFLSVTRGSPPPGTPPSTLSTGSPPPGTPPSPLSTGRPPPGTPPSTPKGAGGVAVWTQSRVAAEEGSSVSVACHYGPQYKDSVKYWCRGLFWSSCIVLQRTDSTQRRAGLSVTDDPAQQVFTVTLSDLRVRDSNRYWCAVKVKGIETPDPKAGVFLSVTRGSPPPGTPPSTLSTGSPPPGTPPSTPKGAGGVAVWTQSRVAAEEGSSVSVACHYGPQYKDSVKYWCRGLFWSSCIVLQRTDSTQRRAGLSVTDDPAQQVFTVTLSDLRVWDSNRYWCAVKVKGIETPDPKAGVFLSVTRGSPPPGTPPSTLSTGSPPPGTPPSPLSTGRPPPGTPPSTPKGAGGVAVWTQSRVAAEEGSSVSVACHYGPQYKDSVKYWCRGLFWSSCIVLQRTDSTQRRAGLSITDDPAQQVFTVTLSDLRVRDSNRYWCAVKVKGIETPDPKAGVFLSVTRALPLTTPRTVVSAATPPPTGCCIDCTTPLPSTLSTPPPSTPSPPPSTPPPTTPSPPTSTAPPSTPPPSTPSPPTSTAPPSTPSPTTPSPSTLSTPPPSTPPPSTPSPPTSTAPPSTPPPSTPSPSTLSTPPPSTPSPPTSTAPPSTPPPTTPPPSTPSPSTPPTSTAPPSTPSPSTPSPSTPPPSTPTHSAQPSSVPPSATPPVSRPKSVRSATPTAPPVVRAGLNRAQHRSLQWWQSLLVACGVLLLVTTVAMVTWKTWRLRKHPYSRWEMDELDSTPTLHPENDSDPTGRVHLLSGRSRQGEHLL